MSCICIILHSCIAAAFCSISALRPAYLKTKNIISYRKEPSSIGRCCWWNYSLFAQDLSSFISFYDNLLIEAASIGCPSFRGSSFIYSKNQFIFSLVIPPPFAAELNRQTYAKVLCLFSSSGCRGRDNSCRLPDSARISYFALSDCYTCLLRRLDSCKIVQSIAPYSFASIPPCVAAVDREFR